MVLHVHARRVGTAAAASALVAVVWSPALAQSTSTWPADRLRPRTLVYVEDTTGHETSGRLLRIDTASLVVQVDRLERRFDAPTVARVSRRDGLKNGALIGAAVGVVMGTIAGGLADCVDDAGHVSGCGTGGRVGITLFSTGFYAAMGAGIDALIHGRTLVYEAAQTSPRR